MVQTDLSQSAAECADWRQALRSYRDELGQNQKALEQLCRTALSKNQLHQVEHFSNQFHIQRINIHDLKQTIKSHERSLQATPAPPDDVAAQHEDLYDRFAAMKATLHDLRSEFDSFRRSVT